MERWIWRGMCWNGRGAVINRIPMIQLMTARTWNPLMTLIGLYVADHTFSNATLPAAQLWFHGGPASMLRIHRFSGHRLSICSVF